MDIEEHFNKIIPHFFFTVKEEAKNIDREKFVSLSFQASIAIVVTQLANAD